MRRYIVLTLATLALAAAPANAQDSLLDACGALAAPSQLSPLPQAAQDAVADQFRFLCAQVAKSFEDVQPTIGIAFSGANPTLGTASTLGRRLGLFPRISLTARANIALADVPNLLDGFNPVLSGASAGATLPAMETTKLPVGSLQGDIALGLFNGVGVGPIDGLGAIDLLGSLSFIPAVKETGLEDNILNFGAGARIGILKQGLLMPGISVTGMYRMMGEQKFGDVTAGDPAEFSTDLSVMSGRIMISKGILLLDVAAGAGYDIYKSDVSMAWDLICDTTECNTAGVSSIPGSVSGSVETAAWNVFANAGLSLLLINVVAEVGYQKVTDVIGTEDLSGVGLPQQDLTVDALEGGRLFGSVGIRITF